MVKIHEVAGGGGKHHSLPAARRMDKRRVDEEISHLVLRDTASRLLGVGSVGWRGNAPEHDERTGANGEGIEIVADRAGSRTRK